MSSSPQWQSDFVFTSHADIDSLVPEGPMYRLKRALLGRPHVTERLGEQRLSNPVALGVLSIDCISSSAYGTEQILTQLVPAVGLAAFSLVVPIMYVIVGVLVVVTSSYFDVIRYYTAAGGSYVVARENFGPRAARIAASALLLDYIVTVAVQCSAGTAALTSAIPSLVPYTLLITVAVVLLLIYGNLRGLKEAGAMFALPAYVYMALMFLTIGVGFYLHFVGHLSLIHIPAARDLVDGHLGSPGHGMLYGVTFLTLLRAYANGGSSLTGLEAISNSVASFRKPESRNAHRVMLAMSVLLGSLLLGLTYLAHWTHAMPYAAGSPTVVSQIVRDVFGGSSFGTGIFYFVQIATVLILYTGGNTSFNGFPFLASFVARDGYLPRQLTKRGHRLAFSNGILILGAIALVLIVAFDARVNALVALYAVGVFTGFALSGSGLVKKHLRERGPRWRRNVVINGVSAVTTSLVVLIFLVVKFTEGAWIIAIVGPLLYLGLRRLKTQYDIEDATFVADESVAPLSANAHGYVTRVIVFVDAYDLATERALEFVGNLNVASVRAVHFDIDPEVTRRLEQRWQQGRGATRGITLEVASCEDRRIERAALMAVADELRDPSTFCMVILPRKGFTSRLQRVLHDRTADQISNAIVHLPRCSATIVPYRAVSSDASTVLIDVARGGRRQSAGLEADQQLAARAAGVAPIGGLLGRRPARIAGRVHSLAVKQSTNSRELRCTLVDETGSVTLVFQGRDHVPGIERGTRLIAEGVVIPENRGGVILNPLYEIVAAPEHGE